MTEFEQLGEAILDRDLKKFMALWGGCGLTLRHVALQAGSWRATTDPDEVVNATLVLAAAEVSAGTIHLERWGTSLRKQRDRGLCLGTAARRLIESRMKDATRRMNSRQGHIHRPAGGDTSVVDYAADRRPGRWGTEEEQALADAVAAVDPRGRLMLAVDALTNGWAICADALDRRDHLAGVLGRVTRLSDKTVGEALDEVEAACLAERDAGRRQVGDLQIAAILGVDSRDPQALIAQWTRRARVAFRREVIERGLGDRLAEIEPAGRRAARGRGAARRSG